MSPTLQALGIDRLSRDERLNLVQEIWDLIAAEAGAPLLSAAQRAEIVRRVAEDEAAPDDVVAWEEVKSETLRQVRQP